MIFAESLRRATGNGQSYHGTKGTAPRTEASETEEKEEKSAAIAQRRNEEFETFKPIEFEMTMSCQQTKNKMLFEFANPIKSSYNNCSS